MTSRRSRQVRRRPVVLVGALLAPAILASGLLAGQMQGLAGGGSSVGVVLGGGGRGVAFEGVLVPAPAHPDRVYEGAVPAPVRTVVVEARPIVEGVEGERDRGKRPVPVVEEPFTPAPVRPRAGCPGEWVETWLWEWCREEERQDGEEGMGGGLLPGI